MTITKYRDYHISSDINIIAVAIDPDADKVDNKILASVGYVKKQGGGGGAGNTDLAVDNITSTTLDINSSTGNSATIPEATILLAGLLIATDKTKLNQFTGVNPGSTTTADSTILSSVQYVKDQITGGGGTATNLSVNNITTTTVDIDSSTGTAATIPTATATTAGLMSGNDKNKLDGIGPAASTNLGLGAPSATSLIITSSTGSPVTLPLATETAAGIISAADKTKLDNFNNVVNLSIVNPTDTTLDVASSTGTNATLSAATSTVAGLLTAADKTKIDNFTGTTDLSIDNITDSTLDIVSSTGTAATIPSVTITTAGLMLATDKTKLDSLTPAVAQEQSDFAETDNGEPDYIKNNPFIGGILPTSYNAGSDDTTAAAKMIASAQYVIDTAVATAGLGNLYLGSNFATPADIEATPTPVEGNFGYVASTNSIWVYTGGVWTDTEQTLLAYINDVSQQEMPYFPTNDTSAELPLSALTCSAIITESASFNLPTPDNNAIYYLGNSNQSTYTSEDGDTPAAVATYVAPDGYTFAFNDSSLNGDNAVFLPGLNSKFLLNNDLKLYIQS